jgi:hypothetical protein
MHDGIESILNKTMVIERKARTLIIEELKQKKYPELSHSLDGTPSYSYLTDLPLFSLTQDKIDEYNRQYNEKKEEHDTYKKTTIEQLWLNELGVFEKKYTKWLHSSEEKTKLEDNKKSKLDLQGNYSATMIASTVQMEVENLVNCSNRVQ